MSKTMLANRCKLAYSMATSHKQTKIQHAGFLLVVATAAPELFKTNKAIVSTTQQALEFAKPQQKLIRVYK